VLGGFSSGAGHTGCTGSGPVCVCSVCVCVCAGSTTTVARTSKSVAQIARKALVSTIAVQAVLCEGDDTSRLCFALQSDFLEGMHSSLLGTRLYYVPSRHHDGVHNTLLREDRGGARRRSWSSSIFTIACYRSSRVVPSRTIPHTQNYPKFWGSRRSRSPLGCEALDTPHSSVRQN
jgi:hypothetical protein